VNTDKKEKTAKELVMSISNLKKINWESKQIKTIRPSEFSLLSLLLNKIENGKGSMKVSELGAALNVTPGAVTHIINMLETKGYVKRKPDFADRRVINVEPSAKGVQIVKKIRGKIKEKTTELVELLGEERSLEFVKTVSIIHDFYMGDNK